MRKVGIGGVELGRQGVRLDHPAVGGEAQRSLLAGDPEHGALRAGGLGEGGEDEVPERLDVERDDEPHAATEQGVGEGRARRLPVLESD